jgi:hypothetical protein
LKCVGPGRAVDTVNGIGVNKVVTIKEGKGLVELEELHWDKSSTARNLHLPNCSFNPT